MHPVKTKHILSKWVRKGIYPDPNGFKPLSDAEKSQIIIDLHMNGVQLPDIASYYRVSLQDIIGWLSKARDGDRKNLIKQSPAEVVASSLRQYDALKAQLFELVYRIEDDPDFYEREDVKNMLSALKLIKMIEDSKTRLLVNVGLIPKDKPDVPDEEGDQDLFSRPVPIDEMLEVLKELVDDHE